MNQKSITVKLIDFTEDDHPFGNVQGRRPLGGSPSLLTPIPSTPFLESPRRHRSDRRILSTRKRCCRSQAFQGGAWFFLKDLKSRDLLDNWSYAAQAKDIPLTVWTNDGYDIIGPEISSSTRELLDCVLSQRSVTAAKVAETLQISVPNASTKLKKLKDQGYILRAEEAAESGGIEYVYLAIGESA